MTEILPFLMFPALGILIFCGIPVGLSLLAIGLVFGVFRFGGAAIVQISASLDSLTTSYAVAAVPLFVLMGAILERSGMAAQLFDSIYGWTRRLPGGVAIGAVIICTVFAAASGITGATETIVGILAVPAMKRYKYDHRLIAGSICAGGSLGTIIPPSVLAIILAPVAGVQVGDLMAGIAIPGLILSLSYIVMILGLCRFKPNFAPRDPDESPINYKALIISSIRSLLPPLVLISAVLGSIMFGIATTTEAAAVGCGGAAILAIINRQFNVQKLLDAGGRAMVVSVAILTILFGGMVFSAVFVASGGMMASQSFLRGLDIDLVWLMVIVLAMGFFLGMMLDQISIIFIIVPVAVPVLKALGADPLVFSVLFMLILQTSYLTPPMAPAVFYFRAISPPEIKLTEMYSGVIPFVLVQFIVLFAVAAFPALATYLPSVLYPLR